MNTCGVAVDWTGLSFLVWLFICIRACVCLSAPVLQSAIEKKLRVLCTSPDLGNPLPSEADTSSADFLFHRAFNLNTLQFQPLKDILEEYETFFGKLPGTAPSLQQSDTDCFRSTPFFSCNSPTLTVVVVQPPVSLLSLLRFSSVCSSTVLPLSQ